MEKTPKKRGERFDMRAIGIVAEYDPFHSGHQYHIKAARNAVCEDLPVVCVMSGNWTQRGSAAIADKWTRARLALLGGADLILELPTPWATASAEGFARGGVEILARAGVDVLCFGSEAGEVDVLQGAANCLDSPEYPPMLRRYLDRGGGFAAARQKAVQEMMGAGADCLDHPNNNLAIEYLRAIRRLGADMKAVTIKRQGDAHNAPASGEGHASASAIRSMLRQGDERTWDWLNPEAKGLLTECADLKIAERAVLAKLRTMTAEELRAIPDCGEGLEHRLLEAAGKAGTLEELYDLTKSKRYAHARIRRVVLRAFLGIDRIPERVPYLRVLGMNGRGREVLRQMGEETVITKPAHGRGIPLLEAEARYTDLYALCFPTARPSGMEWTKSPVILP